MTMTLHEKRANINPLMVLLLLFGLMTNIVILRSSSIAAAQSLRGCPDRCGDLKVPYPFGLAKGCYLADNFFIPCINQSIRSPAAPKAFLNSDPNLLISNISLDGELSILQTSVAQDCYNLSRDHYPSKLPEPVTVSGTKNKLTAVGCDTRGVLEGYRSKERLVVDCTALCPNHTAATNKSININFESCSGVDGCCQTSIPAGLRNISVTANHFSGYYRACGYAFLVEESKFLYSNKSFIELQNSTMVPVVVNWAIGDERCEEAKRRSNISCKGNSTCVNPSNGSAGYLCRCLPGYQGNPYHPDGCQDIDECELSNLCENGKCQNLPGSWDCICPTGYVRAETACVKLSVNHHSGKGLLRYIAPTGICIGLLALLGSSYAGVYWAVKKRNFKKVREMFFEKNGGLILKQYLHSRGHTLIKIFTEDELVCATNNFHEKSVLGKGSFGKIYKGILRDRFIVIKEFKIDDDPAYVKKFIKAVVLLSHVRHRNVVELLGCCLETEVPFLVYEFLNKGSLSQHFHQNGLESSLSSRKLRLKIAADIAQALAYMHQEASVELIHGNVTPSNILLDDDYVAKLVLKVPRCDNIPTEKEPMIIGEIGYIDPEFFLSGRKTKGSDVYSFGIVLTELLTGQRRPPHLDWKNIDVGRNLEEPCTNSMEEEAQLVQLLDDGVGNEEKVEALKEVVNLAKLCLRKEGSERPTMKEVADKLEAWLKV